MSFEGRNVVRLTENILDDWMPVWSPDSKQITFLSNRDGKADIYNMNADGSRQARLTSNGGSDPAWAPATSSRIAEDLKSPTESNQTATTKVTMEGVANGTATTFPKSALLFSQDFEQGVGTWDNRSSTPLKLMEENGNKFGHFKATGIAYPGIWQEGTSSWKNYAFESRVRFVKGNIIPCFYAKNRDFYQGGVDATSSSMYFAEYVSGNFTNITSTNYPFINRQWYKVRLEMVDGLYRMYIDDKLALSSKSDSIPYGGIGFITGEGNEFDVDDIKVWKIE